MKHIRSGYWVLTAIVVCMNCLALLQHIGILPEVSGFLAATLLTNMLGVRSLSGAHLCWARWPMVFLAREFGALRVECALLPIARLSNKLVKGAS
jgi:hypothetical protein